MKVKELGFTLVEMMAVIILLGVVSLIAIPQVNKIIKNTRMSVFKDSAYGVIRAGELYYRNKEINREPLIDTTFVFPEASGLEINGDAPKSGKMVVTSDGSIKLAISNGKYCARKDYDDSKVRVDEDINNCTLESVGTENPGGSGGSGSGGNTGSDTPQNTIITNMELNTTSVSVINGGTYQIEAIISPSNATNKTLRYTSNNTSVATVSSSGLITGISGGETTVTVTTQDGSNISKVIDVIVRQQISNVELDINSASMDVGESVIVNATITPSNAYIKTLKWESSNESVATVNNGIITAVSPGVAIITATTQDGTAIENKINVTVKGYTITYNTDGGILPTNAITSYHASTETFNLPTPTKVGYTFNGWYTTSDFSGSAVTQIVKGTKENKVYYAKWTAKTVKVTFHRNSNSSDTTTSTQTFTYAVSGQSFSNKNWSRTGYNLLGWSTDKNATSASHSTLSGVSDDWINTNAPSIDLYAIWQVKPTNTNISSSNSCATNPATTCSSSQIKSGVAVNVKVNSSTTYTFYVIADAGEELTLILNQNLGGTVAWYSAAGNNTYGPQTALETMKNLTSGWTNISSYNYTLTNDTSGTYTYSPITNTLTTGVRARMLTYSEAINLGCTTSGSSCPTWLYQNTGDGHGYWTSSTYSSNQLYAWIVSGGGFISYDPTGSWTNDSRVNYNWLQGIRPVIKISKVQ